MTSKELLSADLIDILFDNRNKQYGAYTLRRYYNRRLLIALGSSMALLPLLLLLVPGQQSAISGRVQVDTVTIRNVTIPEKKLPPPVTVRPAAPAAPVRSLAFTEPRIVDQDPLTQLPPQHQLFGAVGTSNVDGPEVPQVPPPGDPQPGGTGTGEPAKPEPPGPEAPVQREPEFPGGVAAWIRFLQNNLRVPGDMEPGEKKTVLVQFIVAEDGAVTGFTVLRSSGALYDNEVIRVLKRMPRWKPAIRDNLPAARIFTQPVTFMGVEE